jgi:hypothetical protein
MKPARELLMRISGATLIGGGLWLSLARRSTGARSLDALGTHAGLGLSVLVTLGMRPVKE